MATKAASEKMNIGMIGGGLKSFMGNVHRAAIEQTGLFRISQGAFGTTRQAGYDMIKPLNLLVDDIFHQYREMLRGDVKKPANQRFAFVAAVMPHTMHYPIAMTAMDCGIPVLAEKPFTVNLDEATNLVRKQRVTKTPYRVAMVYPAYSQLVRARKLIRDGALGTLRRFVFSYQNGWMARRVENQGNRQALWRVDAKRNGAGGVLNECAPNCQFVLEWLTGLEISEVCADAHTCVPGRTIPDDATVLVRTKAGISGLFMLSQIAIGHRGGLEFEITGDKAAMLWKESEPGKIVIRSVDGKEKVYTDKCSSAEVPFAETSFGANQAYIDALAHVYRDFAECLGGKRKKSREKEDRILGMTVEEGLRSVAVVSAMEKSFFPVPADLPPTAKWIKVVVPSPDLPVYRKSFQF